MSVEGAILLAAGGSTRMGRPKPLLELDGEPLLLRHLRALRPVAGEIVVVTGARAEDLRALCPDGVLFVHNEAWQRTFPLDSLRLALQARPLDSALVSPIDVLPAAPQTLAALLEAGPPAVACAGGARGHPVLLGQAEIARILSGEPVNEGLRGLLAGAREVEVDDPWVGLDFDDPAAFREACARWGRDRRP